MIDSIEFEPLAVGRLIQQYKEADKFNQLVALYAQEGQGIEDAIQDMLNLRDVATAVGVQLDVIGRIVGQSRTLIDASTLEHFAYFNTEATIEFPNDFVALDTIDMDINGTPMSQVTYATSHANTIALVDAAILASAAVSSVTSSDESPGSKYIATGGASTELIIDNVLVNATPYTPTFAGGALPAFGAGFGDLDDPAEGARFISLDESELSNIALADPEYRLFIQAKILKNRFLGTANEMIAVAVLLGETENVEYTEGVKQVNLNFNAAIDVNRYSLIQNNDLIPKPAGVTLTFSNVIT